MRKEFAPFIIDLYDGNERVGYIEQNFDMTATMYFYGERSTHKDIQAALNAAKHR